MKKWFPIIARVLLGFVFFASGVYAFVSGFATPPDLPPQLQAFTSGLAASVYFMPFLKGVEILCGLLLLINSWVPLALVVLAPIVINILLVHAFLAPQGVVLGIILAALEAYLAFFASPYRDSIRPLFQRKGEER
jgi:putative oxidoreductase